MNNRTGKAKKKALPKKVKFMINDLTFSLDILRVSLIPNKKYKYIPILIATIPHPAPPPY